MIVFGGISFATYCNDLVEYDLVKNSWKEIKCTGNAPPSRTRHASCVVRDLMVMFGGRRCHLEKNRRVYMNDLWFLSLENYHWEQIKSYGDIPSQRCAHSRVARGDNVLVFGGYCELGNHMNDLYELNCFTKVWKRFVFFGEIPPIRSCHIAVVYNDSLIIAGGINNEEFVNGSSALRDVYQIRLPLPKDIIWRKKILQHCFFGDILICTNVYQ